MLDRLKTVGRNLKRELEVYRLVLKHERTPRLARILLGMAIGYVLLPFDLIPDFIPILGHLDDVIIVPLLVIAALRLIDPSVVEDCRARIEEAEGTPA
ncbi:MAG: DUF1232 domain-containing protein [Gemmatimonadetes bacterium]|jgi:uncharacterized membrane protein YkvA (DUF1232 family)|nr:DUF1232 domain-containing protein [Gemmatimonadota bacterium]